MKHYFISDVHLGSGIIENPKQHEDKFIAWLYMAAKDARCIYLLGDIFDFWFEFPRSIQNEYSATLEALRDISSKGVEIHFFCGNHDQWTFGYLEKHCGITVHRKEEMINIDGKNFFLAHGHGLDERRTIVRLMNWAFECKTLQFLFRHIMPAKWAWSFGNKWSESNRRKHSKEGDEFRGENKEEQVVFAKRHSAANTNIDFYIMGHRHIELNLRLATSAQMMILGDFYSLFTYATWDGDMLMMMNYEEE